MINLYQGDCLNELKKLPDNSVDSLVTDPPAGISFMGKDWDSDKGGRDGWIKWMSEVMTECKRVMKPGAHGLVWAIPRTSHWTATALEDAGFEIRDVITHLFGSGFPKSLNISKAIDKAAGAKREVIGSKDVGPDIRGGNFENAEGRMIAEITAPATDEAKQWQGWGTALKPASEHWVLVRKPLEEKTVAANVLKHGTGGINIDASRIEGAPRTTHKDGNKITLSQGMFTMGDQGFKPDSPEGRFPANLVLSHSPYCQDDQCDIECAIVKLDEQSGILKSGKFNQAIKKATYSIYGKHNEYLEPKQYEASSGGASRFFYCAKISSSERNAGLDSYEQVDIDSPCKEENTVAVQLLQKVISESTIKWSTGECGLKIKAIYHKDSKSIIRMEINKIIESKILNCLAQSIIKESTQDVLSKEYIGSSHAENVENLRTWIMSITKESMELALGASRVANETLQKINEKEDWPKANNFHATVKPKKLMSYFIRMITPPEGIVLDPFMGSGSTGIAAKETGFKFIGIEKEPEYFEIASKRING